MPNPAKVALSIFGTIVAIIVIAGLVSPRDSATTSAAPTTTATRATTTPSATPAPTTSAAAAPPVALTPDDRFVAAVLDAGDLVGVGRSVCGSIGAPGVTHAGLVTELAASKWGAAVAEAVVAAAEANLCPERHYAVPAAAPAAEPAPRPQPAAAQPAPRREPAPEPRPAREESSSDASYKNCAAARAAGAAPLHRGDPGYRAGLDRDDDGVACE